jgi:hypothetical protein
MLPPELIDQICTMVAMFSTQNIARLSSTCRTLRAAITRDATVLHGALFWDRTMQARLDATMVAGTARYDRYIRAVLVPMLEGWPGMGKLKLEAGVDDQYREGDASTGSQECFAELLSRLSCLYYLDMTRGHVSRAMLESITRPVSGRRAGPLLRVLRLSQVRTIGDEDVALIVRVTSLTELDLSWTRITDRGASALGACTALECLNLKGCDGLSTGFRGPFHLLPRLQELDLGGRKNALPIALENLASATALRVLSLTDWAEFRRPHLCATTWRGSPSVLTLDFLAPLVSLTQLDLSRGRRVWPWQKLVERTADMPALVRVRVDDTDMPAPVTFPFWRERGRERG